MVGEGGSGRKIYKVALRSANETSIPVVLKKIQFYLATEAGNGG